MKQLSILICSITGREVFLRRLLDTLLIGDESTHTEPNIKKYWNEDCEVLILTDNRQMSIGEKRNKLMNLASGDYVSFIDDDDTVERDYIPQILSKMATKPDCIVFDAIRFVNGRKDKQVKYGIEYKQDSNTSQMYYRIPNHLMVFKREIALQVPYQNVSFGEDADFAKRVLPLIKTQERIDKVLYNYLFTQQSTSNRR